jgi:hypothetical protein
MVKRAGFARSARTVGYVVSPGHVGEDLGHQFLAAETRALVAA